MWRKMVLVFGAVSLLAVSALELPARPVAAAPVAYETAPPAGPVPLGTYGITAQSLVCSSVLAGPYGSDHPHLDEGLVLFVRCYGPNRSGEIENPSASMWGRYGPTQNTNLMNVYGVAPVGQPDPCKAAGSPDPSIGRYEFTCTIPDEWAALDRSIAFGPGVDNGSGWNDHYYFQVCTYTTGNGTGMCTSSGQSPSDASRWRSIGVWQSSAVKLPAWPAWWPVGATPSDGPSDGEGIAPDITCSGQERVDADGVVRATMTVKVNNPLDADMAGWISDTEPEWAFGWENDFEGETAEWFDGETHTGRRLRNVVVPLEGAIPDDGWPVVVRMSRVVNDLELYGQTPDYPLGGQGPPEDESGGWFLPSGWEWTTQFGPGGAGTVILPGPTKVNGYWVPDGVGGGSAMPTVWQTIYAVCGFTVDPRRAGSEEGNGGGRATPVPNPESPLPEAPNPPGEPGPGDGGGCSTPDGWNLLNPLAWMSSAACVLGPLLDLLGEFLDLLTAFFDWLKAAIVPSFGFAEHLEALTEAAEERGPLAWGLGLGGVLGSVEDGFSGEGEVGGDQLGDGDGCPGVEFHPDQGEEFGCDAPPGWVTMARPVLQGIIVIITALTLVRNVIHSVGGDSE